MNKKLLISLLSVLVLSTAVVMADDTTTTNTRPEPPKFENGTGINNRPDFAKGQPPQWGNGQKGQFNGRRPSKKPDAKPGGDRKPPEWDNSSANGQNLQPPPFNDENGQGFREKQPPQFDKNGRPPKPPKEETSTTTNE